MLTIYYDQILFLTFQCFIVAFLLLALFRLRTVFGLSLLLTTLGVFQYMQVFLANALYFEIFEGIFVSSGSSVLFTGSLFAILLVYVKEDTQEARKLIYAILSANIVLIILQTSISLDFEGDRILNIYNLPIELFSQSFRISLIGTLLLFIDAFLIIFMYEIVSKYTKYLFFRILISSIFILSIDSIVFAIFGFYGSNQMERILISGLISKNLAALIYTLIFTLYIKYNEKKDLIIEIQGPEFKDIFQTLTFRQKYEQIYEENIIKTKEITENEKRFKTLVEQASDAYFVHDFNGNFIDVNERACKSLGYTKEELLTMSVVDVEQNFNLEKAQLEWVKIKPNETFILRGNQKRKNGTTFPVEVNFGVFLWKNEKLFIGQVRDITVRLQKELEIKRYASIVETSKDMMAFLDKNFTYLAVNNSYVKAFNLDKDRIVGSRIIDIFGKDFFEKDIKPEAERCLKGEYINYQKWVNFPALGSKYMDIRYSPFYDENNIISGFNVNARDITDSKVAEDKLIEANTIVNRSPAVAFLWNNDAVWSIEFVSENVLSLCGYSKDKFMEQKISFIDLIHPDDLALVQQEVSLASNNASIQSFIHKPYRIISKNKKIKWVQDNTFIRRNSEGIITHFEGIVYDITDKINAENTLIFERNKAQNYLDVAGVMLVSMDSKGIVQMINPKGCDILGYTKEEIIGKNWFDNFIPKNNIDKIKEVSNLIYKGEIEQLKYFENEILTKDGKEKLIAWTNVLILDDEGNITSTLSSGEDITEKKKTEEKYRTLFEYAPEGILIANTESYYLDANTAMCAMLGYTRNELIGLHATDIVVPSEIKNIEPALNIINSEKPYYKEWQFKRKDDSIFSAEVTVTTMPDGNLLALVKDITERKINEKILIEFNNRLQLLNKVDTTILNSKDLNFITEDILLELQKTIKFKRASLGEYNAENNTFKMSSVLAEGKVSEPLITIVEVSKFNFLELDKLKSGEHQIIEDLSTLNISSPIITQFIAIGITSVLFIPLITDKELIGILSLYYDSKEFLTTKNIEISKEIANQLAIALNQHRLRNEILKYTEDLEVKIAERTEQLEFTNRELRDFAQIVSHDLKAPLRAISQLSYWVSLDYADKIDDAGKEQLQMLISRVKRMDNLIEGILQYSRAGKAREKEILIDLNVVVNEVIISLNPPKNIEIHIDTELPKILGDPTRFGQVFQNLIANAIKFNDKSKCIIKLGGSKQGDFWEFYISDNGPGIEEKYFERIFQIFQRLETRDNLEGTGVGLSLVKRIIQIYGGEIWITSKVNKGATFHFTLPIKTLK